MTNQTQLFSPEPPTLATIGQVVASRSHTQYDIRVYDPSEVNHPPPTESFAFGTFVGCPGRHNRTVVGVVSNSQLLNPESGHYGPKLTVPQSHNEIFAPDYLNELGILIHIHLLGYLTDTTAQQSIYPEVLPVGTECSTLSSQDIHRFHRDESGQLQVHYALRVLESEHPLGTSLMGTICDQLTTYSQPQEQPMIAALKRHFVQYTTLGQLR